MPVLLCGIMAFSLVLPASAFAQNRGDNNNRGNNNNNRGNNNAQQAERERQERERLEQERAAARIQMPTGNWLIQASSAQGNDGFWDLEGNSFIPGAHIQINDGQKERAFGNQFSFTPVNGKPGFYYIKDAQGHGVGVPGNRTANGTNLMAFDAAAAEFQQFRVEWNDDGYFRLWASNGKPVATEQTRNATLIQITDSPRAQFLWKLVQPGSNRRTNFRRW
jgi:ribosomal protein S11